MVGRISPPTAIVTAYTAHADATARAAPVADRFGPAVTTPPLSASALGAIDQVTKATEPPPAYDSSGRLRAAT